MSDYYLKLDDDTVLYLFQLRQMFPNVSGIEYSTDEELEEKGVARLDIVDLPFNPTFYQQTAITFDKSSIPIVGTRGFEERPLEDARTATHDELNSKANQKLFTAYVFGDYYLDLPDLQRIMMQQQIIDLLDPTDKTIRVKTSYGGFLSLNPVDATDLYSGIRDDAQTLYNNFQAKNALIDAALSIQDLESIDLEL